MSSMRTPRSRGALSGLLLVLLGIWGALAPLIGPSLGYGGTAPSALAGSVWLFSVLPGAVTLIGGLMLLVTANRAVGMLGGWLAAAAGAWFVVGPILSPLWSPVGGFTPPPGLSPVRAMTEQIGLAAGLGVVIVFLAAGAAARSTVQGVRDGDRGRTGERRTGPDRPGSVGATADSGTTASGQHAEAPSRQDVAEGDSRAQQAPS